MKITVVSGSHRPGSMSRKVCDWIARRLKSNWGDDATVVDLAEKALPMWNEGVWDETPEWEAAFGPINKNDAYIRQRLDYALGILRTYGEALAQVRASGLVDYERYPFGM